MYFYRNIPKNKHRYVFLQKSTEKQTQICISTEIYRKTNINMYFYRNLPKNKHRYVFLQKSTEKQT